MRILRGFVGLAAGAALTLGSAATASAAPTTPSTRVAAAPAPVGAPGFGFRVGGTVPGATGAAARREAGAAATEFAALAAPRRAAAAAGADSAGSAASPSQAESLRQRVRPLDSTLHTDWGLYMPNDDADGFVATQSVVPGLTTTGNDFLYAPTAKSPGGSCIELTTAYTTSGPLLWAWDWCGSEAPGKTVAMDQPFLSTYTTSVNGRPAYTMDEVLTGANNTWTTYLYNYQTGAWDTFYTSSGTDKSGFDFGWDTYEVWSNSDPAQNEGYFCENSLGDTIESSGIQLYTNTWTAANSSDAPASATPPPPGSSFDCPSLSLSLPSADDWIATNP